VTFEESLRAELNIIAGLTNKIYPLNAPDGTRPAYVIYSVSRAINDKTLTGFLPTKEMRVELNVVDFTYAGMKSLVEQVMTVIKSFPHRKIGTNGSYVQNVTQDGYVELYEGQVGWYRCNVEYIIHI
jgi:hypothetical protein